MRQYIYEMQKRRSLSEPLWKKKRVQNLTGGIIFAVMLFVLIYNVCSFLWEKKEAIQYEIRENVEQSASEAFLPAFLYSSQGTEKSLSDWLMDQFVVWFPLLSYLDEMQSGKNEKMDEDTIRKILESQANEETNYDETLSEEAKASENPVPAQRYLHWICH